MKRDTQKKTTITFSIDSIVLGTIKAESKKKGYSLNSRINAILEKYGNFYKYLESFECAVVPKSEFKKMIDIMDQKGLERIMKIDGVSHTLAMMHDKNIPMSISSLIELIFEGSWKNTGAYDSFSSHIDEDGLLSLVFTHEYGIKWSQILAESNAHFIELALGRRVKEKIVLPNTVVIKIESSHER